MPKVSKKDKQNAKSARELAAKRVSSHALAEDIDDDEDEGAARSTGRQYFPHQRNDVYPTHLAVNFQKFEVKSPNFPSVGLTSTL
jgi:hypothetical protein